MPNAVNPTIPADIAKVQWVAVDWGTTHLRAYAMSKQNTVLAGAQSSDGMGKLNQAEFEPALLKLITKWLPTVSSTHTPAKAITVLACGMVGAKQGWREAPYQQAPCPPLDSQQLLAVSTNDTRLQVLLLPGVSQAKPADVMRGEETQLAGLLEYLAQQDSQRYTSTSNGSDERITVCLPGTHSKWASLQQGQLTHFSTFMTGEMFALLCEHSILRHGVSSDGWDEVTFLAGVEQGMTQTAQLLCDCFRLRAQGLLDGLSATAARSRLSGLLLGVELAGAADYWQGQTVHLIGTDPLANLYASALQSVEVSSVLHAPEKMTLAGLTQAYRHIRK